MSRSIPVSVPASVAVAAPPHSSRRSSSLPSYCSISTPTILPSSSLLSASVVSPPLLVSLPTSLQFIASAVEHDQPPVTPASSRTNDQSSGSNPPPPPPPSSPSSSSALAVSSAIVCDSSCAWNPPAPSQLSTSHRLLSATIGALLTSLVVTPFDVVKTRLQSQLHPIHSHPPTPSPSPSSSPLPSGSNRISSSMFPSVMGHRVSGMSISPSPITTSSMLAECSHFRLHTGMIDVWCHRCDFIAAPHHLQTNLRNAAVAENLIHSTGSSTGTFRFPSASTLPSASSLASSPCPSPSSPHIGPQSLQFNGSWDTFIKLVRYEGITSLWRGLSPTLLLSIPSTVVYFALYDQLKLSLTLSPDSSPSPYPSDSLLSLFPDSLHPHVSDWSPLISGTVARAIASTLVSPVELIRTRAQSMNRKVSMRELWREERNKSKAIAAAWTSGAIGNQNLNRSDLSGSNSASISRWFGRNNSITSSGLGMFGGWSGLWRGVAPTLARDVPFSAIYWSSYEHIKDKLLKQARLQHLHHHHHAGLSSASSSADPLPSPSVYSAFLLSPFSVSYQHSLIWSSFLAGASSGMLAATITHPFDLVKTRRQIELYAQAEAQAAAAVAATATAASPSVSSSSLPPSPPRSSTPSTTVSVLRSIVRDEGYLGLFSGLGARIGKIAPSCAIMISTYELAKQTVAKQQQLKHQM